MDNILLINDLFGLPGDYRIELVEYCGFRVNKGMIDDLIKMMAAIEKEIGYNNLLIQSAYRSPDEQKSLFEKREKEFEDMGIENPHKRTTTRVAFPGYSEHQTGLALDIISEDAIDYESFGDTESGNWLRENSWRFGFILRYPKVKTIITRTDYEPWHFTYVGKSFAYYFHTYNKTIDEIHLDLRYEGEIHFEFDGMDYGLSIVRPDEDAELESETILKGTALYNIKVTKKKK